MENRSFNYFSINLTFFLLFLRDLSLENFRRRRRKAAAIERSVASTASKGGIEEGAANNSAQGDKAPRPKNVPFAPSTNQGSKTTGSASLPDTEREQKKIVLKKILCRTRNQTHI